MAVSERVEQEIRKWIDSGEAEESGACFVLGRDYAQRLVDEIAADRELTAGQVASNWQQLLTLERLATSHARDRLVESLDLFDSVENLAEIRRTVIRALRQLGEDPTAYSEDDPR